jgi:gentisate 1,2-dioxygenase
MLKLSDIKSSDAELQEYYAQLRSQHVTPAWIGGGISLEAKSKAVPYVWHWRELRSQAMRAAQLVGTEQAERRVLRLTNPELAGVSASNTMVANIQIVMPGEIARAHRHSASALRLIIEGKGGYTVVNGDRIPMSPGDLVLTPNWTWHDHANDTDAPMIWLDGLDTPLVRMLEAGFYEEYYKEIQTVGEGVDPSFAKYGDGGLRPAWEAPPSARYSPLWHYPMSQARAALERLASEHSGSPFDGVILEYTNPVTGGPAMPTIACYIQLLRPGARTQAHRQVACTNYHVIEGSGYSVVGGQQLDWEDKDVFTVPTWTFREHVNRGHRPAFLFSFTDAPVMKALDLYREETKAR